jgi:hypothetical protein
VEMGKALDADQSKMSSAEGKLSIYSMIYVWVLTLTLTAHRSSLFLGALSYGCLNTGNTCGVV